MVDVAYALGYQQPKGAPPAMNILARVATTIGGVGLILVALAYVGLKIRPHAFPAYPAQTPPLHSLPLPQGLPAPVERYYRASMGDTIPQVTSAVLTGSADLRFSGITFPARWRFTHQAGRNYRHYIEATLFGRPLMKVNEHFLDGHLRMELPVGIVENDPKTDSAANLALWGESLFFPSVFLTDSRVHWEPIDDTHARLIVPDDTFTVTFDPDTGLLQHMETMRWKEPTSTSKTPWHLDPLAWERFHGVLIPARFAVTWGDEKGPWLVGTIEGVEYNVDVDAYVKAFGP